MAFVRLNRMRAFGGFRRTLRSGQRYQFQPGEVAEVADEHLAELLATSPLEQVSREDRGGRTRWRPITEKVDKAGATNKRRRQNARGRRSS